MLKKYFTGKSADKVYLVLNKDNVVIHESAALDRPVKRRLVSTDENGLLHPSLFPRDVLKTPLDVYPRDIELRVHNDCLQWRYTGDESWKKLVDLQEISGSDGKTPVLAIRDGTLCYRYADTSDWISLIDLYQLGSIITYNNPKTKVAVGGIAAGTVLQNIPLTDILNWMFNGNPASYELDKTALSIEAVVNGKKQVDGTFAGYSVFSFFKKIAAAVPEISQEFINKKVQIYLTALSALSKESPSLDALNAIAYYADSREQPHYTSEQWTNFISVKTAADTVKSTIVASESDIIKCVNLYLQALNFLHA
jgi:hypothetical protein